MKKMTSSVRNTTIIVPLLLMFGEVLFEVRYYCFLDFLIENDGREGT